MFHMANVTSVPVAPLQVIFLWYKIKVQLPLSFIKHHPSCVSPHILNIYYSRSQLHGLVILLLTKKDMRHITWESGCVAKLVLTLENSNFSAPNGTEPHFPSYKSCSTVTNWLSHPGYILILFPIYVYIKYIVSFSAMHATCLILSSFFINSIYSWKFNHIHRMYTLYIRIVWRSYPVVGQGPCHILVNLIIALVPNFILFWEQEIHKLQQNTLNQSAHTVQGINILNQITVCTTCSRIQGLSIWILQCMFLNRNSEYCTKWYWLMRCRT